MRAGGYRTAWIGKFLNGWDGELPSGWDEFVAHAHGPDYASGAGSPFYNYSLDGTHGPERRGAAPEDYSERVHLEDALEFIAATPEDQPLFLVYAPNAPHASRGALPPEPAPEHVGLPVPTSWSPNTNERDLADKVDLIRSRPRIPLAELNRWAEDRARSLLAVDESMEQLVAARELRDRPALLIFTSDNGFSLGSHRWMVKSLAYEESLRVPLWVSWQGMTGRLERLTSNVDLAATITAAAGIDFSSSGSDIFSTIRKYALIQGAAGTSHSWCGVRTLTKKYILYEDGHEEVYDLLTDPWELHGDGEAPQLRSWTLANCVMG
jgi:arylsulfatase A-like enzyme